MEYGKVSNKPLNILFITQDDPFYIRIFFEEFFKRYLSKNNILGVVSCPTMGKSSLGALIRQMYNFYGPIDFFRMGWRYFLARLGKKTLKGLCLEYKVPVFDELDINSSNFVSYWKNRQPDVIISVAAPQIFKEGLINLPKWGCINIHHAKLPRYRGMMPNFWQMYHNEQNAGITVHKINAGLDEGQIILQKDIDIEAKDTLDSLIKRSKRMGAGCINEALEMIKENKVDYIPNHKEEGSYFSFPKKEDLLEFRSRGKRIL